MLLRVSHKNDFLDRGANDSDHPMVGNASANVLAHANFPERFPWNTNKPPKVLPCHFDDSEHVWVNGSVLRGYGIETVALHEIGHVLELCI